MKSKKIKIEYFLLMGIAFLFHSVEKNEFIFTNKKILNYFAKEESKNKVLYGFILEFQEKVEGFGIKKDKMGIRRNSLVPDSLENTNISYSYNNFNLIKEEDVFDNSCLNIFLSNIGIGEKMYKSSYLV